MNTLQDTPTFQIILGNFAYDWLSNSKDLHITGITSSGIFLKTNQEKIIFFTTDNHFGPVNVVFDNSFPPSWKNQSILSVEKLTNSFFLSDENNYYHLQIGSIWKSPLPPEKNITSQEQSVRFLKAAKQLVVLKGNAGFSPLLIPYIEKQKYPHFEDDWLERIWKTINELEKAILHQNNSQILNLLSQMIGSGRGLTPSGDDFLSGMFLMQKRWFPSADWFGTLSNSLYEEFDQKTTAVSSTLFYCATAGEADYRILEMADTLMNVEIPVQTQIFNIARWGNSSGADLFLGLILAIRCFQKGSMQ